LISASQKLIQEGPPRPPDWVASVPLIGGHVADYWNYLDKSSSVRLQELARLLPAAKTIVSWGGSTLAEGIFRVPLVRRGIGEQSETRGPMPTAPRLPCQPYRARTKGTKKHFRDQSPFPFQRLHASHRVNEQVADHL
jgi:hypothetical protein